MRTYKDARALASLQNVTATCALILRLWTPSLERDNAAKDKRLSITIDVIAFGLNGSCNERRC